MANRRKLLTLLFTFSISAGCFKSEEKAAQQISKVKGESSTSIQIPVDIWDLIESVYTEEDALDIKKQEEGKPTVISVKRKKSKVQSPLRNMKIKVLLKENFPKGILSGRDYEISYKPGGGVLDLADYVALKKEGSFKIQMILNEEVRKKSDEEYVFYWSNGKRRDIDGETYGSGCENFYDVTRVFNNTALSSGMTATTQKVKYVTSLAGTYIFVIKSEGALYVSQLTIEDSRYHFLQCRNHKS